MIIMKTSSFGLFSDFFSLWKLVTTIWQTEDIYRYIYYMYKYGIQVCSDKVINIIKAPLNWCDIIKQKYLTEIDLIKINEQNDIRCNKIWYNLVKFNKSRILFHFYWWISGNLNQHWESLQWKCPCHTSGITYPNKKYQGEINRH